MSVCLSVSGQAEEAEALAAAAGGSKTNEPPKVTPKIFTARRARDRLKKNERSQQRADEEDEVDDPALENLRGEDPEPVKVRVERLEHAQSFDGKRKETLCCVDSTRDAQ